MLAIACFVLTYGGLALYAFFSIAWWQDGMSLWSIITNTLAAIALFFLVIFLYYFSVINRHRSIPPDNYKIGFSKAIVMIIKELGLTLYLYFIVTPLTKVLDKSVPKRGFEKNDPAILMVHGFLCNGALWLPLQSFLEKKGLGNLYTITLEPPIWGNIEEFAKSVAVRVDEICEQSESEQVIIIAHSMGGIVSRFYLDHLGGNNRVSKLITIGSPHHGTHTADTVPFLGENVRQMRIRSNSWLKELNSSETKPAETPITSIYSYHDDIVVPQESSKLKNAKNVAFSGLGHFNLLFSRSIQDLIYREIIAMSKTIE